MRNHLPGIAIEEPVSLCVVSGPICYGFDDTNKIIRVHLSIAGHDNGYIYLQIPGLLISGGNGSPYALIRIMLNQIYALVLFGQFFDDLSRIVNARIINNDNPVHKTRNRSQSLTYEFMFIIGRDNHRDCFMHVHNSPSPFCCFHVRKRKDLSHPPFSNRAVLLKPWISHTAYLLSL